MPPSWPTVLLLVSPCQIALQDVWSAGDEAQGVAAWQCKFVRLENHLPQRQWQFQVPGNPSDCAQQHRESEECTTEKLLITLSKVASALCTSRQPETEPLQYRDAVYPRLTLDQTLVSLPTFWFD